MSRIGTAYLEATSDDMGPLDGKPSSAVKLIKVLIEDNDLTVDQAAVIGWSVHEIDTAINRLNAYDGDLSVISDELDQLTGKLTKVAGKASRKAN